MSGDQRRSTPPARSARAMIAASVTSAMTGAAESGASPCTCRIWPIATGRIATAMSISAVPETTGVMIRRRAGSQLARAR